MSLILLLAKFNVSVSTLRLDESPSMSSFTSLSTFITPYKLNFNFRIEGSSDIIVEIYFKVFPDKFMKTITNSNSTISCIYLVLVIIFRSSASVSVEVSSVNLSIVREYG